MREGVGANPPPSRLGREFYDRDTVELAKALLGKILVVAKGGVVKKCRIVEVEAYLRNDPASHSYRGMTKRNKSMFGPPGTLYVFVVHRQHCANVVRGNGEAVLLRAGEPILNITSLTNGPGKLTRALGIRREADDGKDLTDPRSDIWIEDDGFKLNENDIIVTTRVGITRAKDWPLRFYIRWSPYVSKKIKENS